MELVPFTYGRNHFDTSPFTVLDSTWDDIRGVFQQAFEQACQPHEKGTWIDDHGHMWKTKKEVPPGVRVRFTGRVWIAPMILAASAEGRSYDAIKAMSSFAGFDLDAEGWSQERLLQTLAGVDCIIHTTTNSTCEHPRYRIFIKLTRECRVEEFGPLWLYANDLFDGELDPNTKDATRIFVLPATWAGANNWLHMQEGHPLSVDLIVEEYGAEFIRRASSPATCLDTTDPAPPGTAIISQEIINRHFAGRPPSGRFFKTMSAAAARFKHAGWALTDQALCDAAMKVSAKHAPGTGRENPLREAQRAIGWANAHITTERSIERHLAKPAVVQSMQQAQAATAHYEAVLRKYNRHTI